MNLNIDPLSASIIGGLLMHLLQTIADKPWWNANTRRFVAVTLAVLISVAIWYAGTYPASWQLLLTQASVALATAQTAFTIMKSIRLPNGETPVDWLGRVTPGGEDRYPPQRSTHEGHTK